MHVTQLDFCEHAHLFSPKPFIARVVPTVLQSLWWVRQDQLVPDLQNCYFHGHQKNITEIILNNTADDFQQYLETELNSLTAFSIVFQFSLHQEESLMVFILIMTSYSWQFSLF